MSDSALVADTSALILFMEGHAPSGRVLFDAEVHISVVTEIERRTMSRLRSASEEVIRQTLSPSGT